MKKHIMLALLLTSQIASAQALKEGMLVNTVQLTQSTTRFENPRWSNDGKQIAFTEMGFDHLYVMDKTGKNLKKISDANGIGYGYEWSADNKEILVRDTRWSREDGRLHAIWTIKMDGTHEKISEDAQYMRPATWRYSTNGMKRIVLNDGKMLNGKAKLVPVAKKTLQAVKAQNYNYNKSFYEDGDALYLIDEMGNKIKINDQPSFHATFSPDGTRIAFEEIDNIVVMNADGTDKRILTTGHNPTWANNTQLIIEQTLDEGHTYIAGELFLVNALNGAVKQLTATPNRIEMNPKCSPDGSKVVYSSFLDGQIYVADLK